MSRPQVIVTVRDAVPRRGADSVTGTAFLLYAGATGTETPVVCKTTTDATATSAPAQVVQYVGDALTQGAPRVVLLRATAADPANVTQAEWATALGLLTDGYGVGQVLIPGVTTSAAYAALLAHADAAGRCVLLDCAPTFTRSALVTTATGLASAAGAERATIVTGAVLNGTAPGTTRTVPGSVIAAGLAARGDAANGHANNQPIADAGVVVGGVGVPTALSDADLDALHDVGVSCIIPFLDFNQGTTVIELGNWESLSQVDAFRQLNWGRFGMQIAVGAGSLLHQFIGKQIDGNGHLFAEVKAVLSGYLTPLWTAGALYGDTAADAFEVIVDETVNTPATIAAGEVHALVGIVLTPGAEKVYADVVTTIAQGVAA
jgi:hypothetical protein